MAAALKNHASLKSSKMTLVVLSLLAVMTTLYIYNDPTDYITDGLLSRMLGLRRQEKRAVYLKQPRRELIWVMSHPLAGADEIINMVERATLTSMGTNYGNIVQTSDMKKIVNTHESRLIQKRWYTTGPFQNNVDFDLPAEYGDVLVKTYCTGYCLHKDGSCGHSYSRDLVSKDKFWNSCAGGTQYISGKKPEVKRAKPYWRNQVKKVIVVVRSPFNMVTARFREHMHEDNGEMSAHSFNSFCQGVDNFYMAENKEIKMALKRNQRIKPLVDGVKCVTEFWRIAMWYQQAFAISQRRNLLIIHREEYVLDQQSILNKVLIHGGMKQTNSDSLPIFTEDKVQYFNGEEKEKIGALFEAVVRSDSDTWASFKHYFVAIEDEHDRVDISKELEMNFRDENEIREIFGWNFDITDLTCPTVKSGCSDVRFSQKLKYMNTKNGATGVRNRKLFQSGTYPVTTEQTFLKLTNAVSVVTQTDCELKASKTVPSLGGLINDLGGSPTHAPDPAFWRELEEVVSLQALRKERGNELARNIIPWFPLPTKWQDFSMNDVAEAVRADFPGAINVDLIKEILKSNAGLTLDNDILYKRCNGQFLHTQVMLADMNTWAVGTVAPVSFGIKWHVGRARPEEVVFKVKNGECNTAAPQCLKNAINSMGSQNGLKCMEQFTAYAEGAPNHPSWPAMHSAAASISMWLAVVANLTPEQFKATKVQDLAVSMARSVAGVHYKTDNISGLKIGQEVLARELPSYLAERYCADPDKVRAKIEKVRFDWDTESVNLLAGYDEQHHNIC